LPSARAPQPKMRSKQVFDEGDDSEDEELLARKAMDARLKLLEQRLSVGKSKTGGLSSDRDRLFAVLEDRGAGSILRGWRRELDQDGALEIGFPEFCRAMSNLGVHIDALRLFQGNAEPQTFKLQDLAPEAAALLSRFREWVKATFDGPAGMFGAFDPMQAGIIGRAGFVSGCMERNAAFTEDELEELFNCIDFDDGGSVTPDEIVFLEIDPQTRDHEIFKLKMRSKFQRQRLLAYTYWDDGCREVSKKHRRAQRPWHSTEFEKLPPLVCKKRVDQQQQAYKNTIMARISFLQHLREKYGNEARAWRRGLDPECNFRMSKSALRQYLRHHDLHIDFQALWRALDCDGDESINLEELNAKVASELARFRAWSHEQFGSCSAVWDLPEVIYAREVEVTDEASKAWKSDKKMRIAPFAQVMRSLGWQSDEGSILYQSMDLYGCGFLSLPDFWWLDAWDPPEWLVDQPNPMELMELQTLIQAIYPQPLNAWRALLDTDSDNQVNWIEFLNACRKVKFTGNPGAAWRALDRDVSGTITLREWDSGAAELLSSFKRWCEVHFGSVELAFKAMDKTGIGSLTLSDLRTACRRLNWNGDVRMLFSCLGVSASKEGKAKTLLLSDIAFIDSWIDQDVLDYAALQLGRANCSSTTPSGRRRSAVGRSRSASSAGSPHARMASRGAAALASRSADSAAVAPPTGGAASLEAPTSVPSALARTEFEKLHRRYHCVHAAKKSRPPAVVAAKASRRAKSLPWLEKINLIDERYGACH